MPASSAGILLYRRRGDRLEVLLVHPGGPFWARRDQGAWSIPKGEYAAGEDPVAAARREFAEELGAEPPEGPVEDLDEVRQKAGKRVHAWALERDLLARHRAIDMLLEHAIEHDGVTQVIEAAAGLSPRGWRFTERHPELVYIEGDLPGMVERKRDALERMGSLSDRHRVVELDVLRPRGKASLSVVARGLDKRAGLAIITEGLLSYLPRDAVDGAWRRFAGTLGRFAAGRYFSELQLSEGVTPEARAFRVLLAAFVRGDVHLHFERAADAEAALLKAGFRAATVRPATDVLGVQRDGPS